MSRSLEDRVRRFIRDKELFSAPCCVLLGLSGGADSMCLLHILCSMAGVDVFAVHIHHGLRGEEADRDVDFVKQQCAARGVSLTVRYEDVTAVAEQNKLSFEEAGRRVRYDAFEEIAVSEGIAYIATAHNADDQAETVLLRLIRGTGVDGLAGIAVKRGRVIRPLLSCSRKEIEAYCLEKGVPYITDSTNVDTRYSRNYCRHELLPLMETLNPDVRGSLCRLAEYTAEDRGFWAALIREALESATCEDGFDARQLAQLPSALRRRVLIAAIRKGGCVSYDESHLLSAERALMKGEGSVCLPGQIALSVSQGRMRLLTEYSVTQPLRLHFDRADTAEIRWDNTTYRLTRMNGVDFQSFQKVHKMFFKYAISCDTIQGGLYVRSREEGDYLHPAGRGIGKSLKKLFNEWKIPTYQRCRVPLLCDERGVLLVPGYACDERVHPDEKTKLFLVWEVCSEKS